MTSLSNDTENPLLYDYTDKGQSLISLAYCHLNSFLAMIIFIHEERLGVCVTIYLCVYACTYYHISSLISASLPVIT